ncbi:MAG: DUF2723 domain-containing protein [Bacteroidota bacterium]
MKNYQKINNIIGWIVFAIASAVYILTCEPTGSFWDCGEYISTAYKLMVGHPPGAPMFQLMGRIFTLFAGDNLQHVSLMVNYMSALASGFTILFMFWSITMLAKKLVDTKKGITAAQAVAIFASGVVGSLAYTFSDSFWFSAVEGEVYATSSFFTAIVFWAILKWETVANEKGADRWLILIAYLMGLSIGVHLLNLLAIPAMTFVYYFKKYKTSTKGFIITSIISVAILGIVQSIIIPQIVNLFAKFELLFVNGFGMPFNSGTIFFALLVIGLITFGLIYTKKKGKVIYNTIILCFTFIIIGYSSFLMLVIRSNANTPLDENNPDNAISLLSYLNREQYGDWPILSGQYYNAPLDAQNPYSDGNPVYAKNEKTAKYEIIDERKNTIPNYDKKYTTIFPRMWSSQAQHIQSYKNWADIKGDGVPSFGENLTYMMKYQVGWMYMRYFLWNFVGRQNDIQGHGSNMDGNWISGISFIDNWRLGNQDLLPDDMKKNKGRNTFFFLPLLLGLAGLFYQYKKNKMDFWVVLLLFVFTGLAIVFYLNQYPMQPRERDYAFAASFYAFAIWIGLGVLALVDWIGSRIKSKELIVASAIGLVCLVSVPGIMAKEGWDDHDRSNRYTSLAIAKNYLNSCAPNAILFTNGDNDTFPLWYAQEVEGFRTDVRVCNLSLLNTDWYIDQMCHKAYKSDPMPFTLKKEQYRQGTRDVVYLFTDSSLVDPNKYYGLKEVIGFATSNNPRTKINTGRGTYDYIPTKNFMIPVDKAKVLSNGTVTKNQEKFISPSVYWSMKENGVQKNNLMLLDMLSCFNWERPVYFAITTGPSTYIGLEPWFQLEGLTYRLIPVKDTIDEGQPGAVNTAIMYDNLMNKFVWGNINNPKVYLDETNRRMAMNFRNNFYRLANALTKEGKKDSAIKVLDRCMQVLPKEAVAYDYFMLPIADCYYRLGKTEMGNTICKDLSKMYIQYLDFYLSLDRAKVKLVQTDKQRDFEILQRIYGLSTQYKNTQLAKSIEEKLREYSQKM